MALVRSPSFGCEEEFDGIADTSQMMTTSGLRSVTRPLRLEDLQETAPSSGTLSGTPTSKYSARTLPDNPYGTPPRKRGPSIPSKSPRPTYFPSCSSASRSPGRGSPAPHFGTEETPAASWKFQSTAEVRSEPRRRDWSPARTAGAERGCLARRSDRIQTMPCNETKTSLKAIATPLPVSHSQPIGYPVELSPRRTQNPVAKQPTLTVTADESLNSSISLGISASERSKQTSFAARSGASNTLIPQDVKPQSLKSGQGRNQFTFIRMMEGNKAFSQRPVPVDEVAKHNKRSDCWIILSGKVYDVTSYLPYHPGGKSVLAQCAGRDATKEYAESHPWVNYEQLIGKLCLGPVDNKKRAI